MVLYATLLLTPEVLSFDYPRVPRKYHASTLPDDELVLYKGALRGLHETGFLSKALRIGRIDHLLDVKRAVENGTEEEIAKLIARHTSGCDDYTPFLSATFNPEEAQFFVPTHGYGAKPESTIYRLRIPAKRCVLDADNTGCTGASKEILVLGAIFPGELTAVKISNDSAHSELISQCGYYIRPSPVENNRNVKDPTNWLEL